MQRTQKYKSGDSKGRLRVQHVLSCYCMKLGILTASSRLSVLAIMKRRLWVLSLLVDPLACSLTSPSRYLQFTVNQYLTPQCAEGPSLMLTTFSISFETTPAAFQAYLISAIEFLWVRAKRSRAAIALSCLTFSFYQAARVTLVSGSNWKRERNVDVVGESGRRVSCYQYARRIIPVLFQD